MKKMMMIVAATAMLLTVIVTGNGNANELEESLTSKEALSIAVLLMEKHERVLGFEYSEEQLEMVIHDPFEVLRMGTNFLPEGDEIIDTDTVNSYTSFRNLMAKRESTNNWKAINQLGYMGLFQFGRLALTDCGLTVDVEEFRSNPEIFSEVTQIKTFDEWVKILDGYMGSYGDRFDGRTIQGTKVTKSGMIAGAHLVGHGAMKRWLNGETGICDGNGVDVAEYVELFAGYDLSSHLGDDDIVLAMN